MILHQPGKQARAQTQLKRGLTMANAVDRDITKEIMIAYIAHSNAAGALFNPDSIKGLQFESVWDRIMKMVTESVR